GLLQEISRRARLRLEGKRSVGVNRYHDRNLQVGIHLRGLRVESLAELHDVYAMLTQSRANRRRRISLARRYLKLDVTCNLLCHKFSFRFLVFSFQKFVFSFLLKTKNCFTLLQRT